MIPKGIETVSLRGKLHPLFGSVLQYAHTQGLIGIKVELLQPPLKSNDELAIVLATAVFERDGKLLEYQGLGDAGPRNLSPNMVPASVRMAETRAKGRALRDGCGIHIALFEEMPDTEDTNRGQSAPAPPPQRAAPQPTNGSQQDICSWEEPGGGVCGQVLLKAETAKSLHSFKRKLCKEHQVRMVEKIASRPAV